jgi:probable HAF family extracellular repeat protein
LNSNAGADAVNDAGQAAGYGMTTHAFLFGGGAMRDFGTLGAARPRAFELRRSPG